MRILEGSPPRVRGKAEPTGKKADYVGITPACAGKSLHGFIEFPAARDHPRVCGEKHDFRKGAVDLMGSPPRVRGKVGGACGCDCFCGITPACAGKSVNNNPQTLWIRDHPRVCGEKDAAVGAGKFILGSPPRVRGKGTGSCTRRV